MNWYIKKFEELTTNELYEILKERTNVFVVEQNCPYPEVDGKDIAAHHVFLEKNGEIIAYSRVLPAGVAYKEVSFGRVLVKKEHRGTGLAKELLEKVLHFLETELKETTIKIQAQDYLQQFYGSFGFEAISDVYLEDNIPHINMLKK
ncbi:GNAT family N-acetyltransferase [Bacillus sp. DX4.1]|uniref:GNAT family N-acetyltransferase n=1 Tax=Bacillus sp. DX4.1 TaxID=3055867 RepID=UPI0025A26D89|nr:GNAT family N-acetyltransferase [Bacillus sp. DX4.1]MDM5190796.1 GNAT family N-acetyltransferase [Bacillus sp. DX4.1]